MNEEYVKKLITGLTAEMSEKKTTKTPEAKKLIFNLLSSTFFRDILHMYTNPKITNKNDMDQ